VGAEHPVHAKLHLWETFLRSCGRKDPCEAKPNNVAQWRSRTIQIELTFPDSQKPGFPVIDIERERDERETEREISKKLARFGEGAPRSDCPTVPCTTPETVYDHASATPPLQLTPAPGPVLRYARALPLGQGYEQQRSKKRYRRSPSR
jgi:hypothetical protein